MRTMKMQYTLLFLSLFPMGCGGSSNSPVTAPSTTYVDNTAPSGSSPVLSGTKFKSPQEAIKWLAKFYKQNDVDIEEFQGQLESIYNSGVSLGHIFILARLSYVTGMEPDVLMQIKEGGAGWTAVMDAFQIKGLGVYSNLGDLLRNNPGSGIVDGTPGTK